MKCSCYLRIATQLHSKFSLQKKGVEKDECKKFFFIFLNEMELFLIHSDYTCFAKNNKGLNEKLGFQINFNFNNGRVGQWFLGFKG